MSDKKNNGDGLISLSKEHVGRAIEIAYGQPPKPTDMVGNITSDLKKIALGAGFNVDKHIGALGGQVDALGDGVARLTDQAKKQIAEVKTAWDNHCITNCSSAKGAPQHGVGEKVALNTSKDTGIKR